MTSLIYYHGLPLEQAQGDTPRALCLLAELCDKQRSFRALQQSPWIIPLEGHHYIECSTGGTSGTAKIIRRHQDSWQRSFRVNQNHFNLSADDRYAVFGELNHSLALYAACESIALGIAVEILSRMRPRSQRARLIESGVTVLYITPTQLRLLIAAGEPCTDVRLILCGGSKLDDRLREQTQQSFPNAHIHEFYGASETSFISLSDSNTPPGSVGKAYPGVDIIIKNISQQVGEVWLKSPYLFDSYAQGSSDETRYCAGYITVGEMGRLDSSGNLWLYGRKSRMVTSADNNVYPERVEALIGQLTGCLCAVIARPDRLRGWVLWAYLQGPLSDDQEQRLRLAIRHQLGSIMEPKKFFGLACFPQLPSGKPDLQQLEAGPTL